MTYADTMEAIARGFEVAGVAVILIGGVLAFIGGAREFRNEVEGES